MINKKNKNRVFGFQIVESVKDEKIKGHVMNPQNVMWKSCHRKRKQSICLI